MKKLVILSDFYDTTIFDKFSPYEIFDKESLNLSPNKDKVSIHFNGAKILKSITEYFKDNDTIVYLLYTSDPEKVINNLRTEFPKYDFSFSLVTEEPEGCNEELYSKVYSR